MTLLYAGYAGSKLYGLMTPTSDIDVRGVFIEPANIFFSLDTFDYYEDAASDTVMFSLRRFMHLAVKNNPNILDMIFAPKTMWITATPEWEQIYKLRHDILSKRAIHAYRGFILQEYDKWLVNKTPRVNLVEQYGYDGKMVSHVMRLIYQLAAIEVRGTYSPVLTVEERSVVYGMKTHTMERKYVEKLVNEWMQIITPFYGAPLLDEPNYDLINRTVTEIHTNILRCHKD